MVQAIMVSDLKKVCLEKASSFRPTIDRPFFNIYLWDYFNRAVDWATGGSFQPENFEFAVGKQPLSEPRPVLLFIAAYYVVIFGGRSLLKSYKPLKLTFISQIHNLMLTSVSFLWLVLMLEQMVPIVYRHGLYFAICNVRSWTQPMETLYYFNYMTKFVEFADTVLMVLKHRRLTFLHTYHHGATALLCYNQLVGYTAVTWVPVTLNLAVHVLMYWYYFLSASGIRVWWKAWVTRLQIVQFMLDLVVIYFVLYQKIVAAYFRNTSLPYCGDCLGSMTAISAGAAILTSYLFLFISFYIEVYKGSGVSGKKKINKMN
ncbi:Elo1p [Saccharomyces cerevisiae x Saccharomyces kudriavzevii VIN7]|nr:Elo1p [Saccharomyces cerevisiae x Saccharomyces kudriavzevii VIN7]